jgi:hypothetical protein
LNFHKRGKMAVPRVPVAAEPEKVMSPEERAAMIRRARIIEENRKVPRIMGASPERSWVGRAIGLGIVAIAIATYLYLK